MSIGKTTISIDRIETKSGVKIQSAQRVSYDVRYALSDLDDDDHITKNILESFFPIPAAPIVASVVAGDTQPLTIAHTGMTWPNVIYRNADGSRYGGATDTDDGTNIIITGDADGSGNFADSFTVIIK